VATASCATCVWEAVNNRKVDATMSNVAWGAEIGVNESSVRRHQAHKPVVETDEVMPFSNDQNAKGDITKTLRADRIIPLSEWLDGMREDGQDPDDYTHSFGHSLWGQKPKNGELVTLYANRFSASKKNKKELAESVDYGVAAESVLQSVRSFTYVPTPVAFNPETAVIMPADLQVGKSDLHGSSKETVEQALHSFHEFAAFVKEFRPQEICMVDAGDPIENVFNTSAQLGTNDLDLPHQIEIASNVFLEGIKLFAPLAPKLRFAAVSSNHGAFRLGPKAPGGDAHADFGIVIANMLRNALKLNDAAFNHVTVQTPDPYMESLYFQTSGSDIGVVHGHQAGGPDKLGTWWQGQTHGNLPVSKARILLAGHWHSLRVYQSGDGRWVIVGPSSDRGSTWFTNLKGEAAQSGMLSFTTSDNAWSNLRIL